MKILALLTLILFTACCDQPPKPDCPDGWYARWHYQSLQEPHGIAMECRKLPWTD